MQRQFIAAINQIAEEKNIPKEVILETVQAALAAAYKKDYGQKDQDVSVKIDEETGDIRVFINKEVVKEVENPYMEISPEDAKKIKKTVKEGDFVEIEDFPEDFGRIAAQTAKQIIIQRIREAERDIVFSEYKDKEGDLVNASVQRIEGNTVIVDLGQASGVLFANEQVDGERYYIGQRLKVFIVKVEQSTRGPQVVVSRSHPGVVKRLFEVEVPEIEADIVQIKAIAREAGHRTKIAVASSDENVDPVGSCVGQRGVRVQSVLAELGEEKIDVILFSEDPKEFITNALSPAKVVEIDLNEEENKAKVFVPEDQLSLAIGKSGQNVRLAAKLSGWNIDIETKDASGVESVEEAAQALEEEPKETVGENKEIQSMEENTSDKGPAISDKEVKETEEKSEEASAEEAKAEDKVEENIEEETPLSDNKVEKPTEKTEKSAVKEIEEVLQEEGEEEKSESAVEGTSDEKVEETPAQDGKEKEEEPLKPEAAEEASQQETKEEEVEAPVEEAQTLAEEEKAQAEDKDEKELISDILDEE